MTHRLPERDRPWMMRTYAGHSTAARSNELYRRNLARVVRTPEELRKQISVTLLHEVGHLRGEDDGELAARGLE